MKKIPLLQFILVFVLIGLVVIGFVATKNKTSTVSTSKPIVTESFDNKEDLYKAEQKGLQEKMTNSMAYNSAVDSLDISVCDTIVNNETLKGECRDNVYSAMASKGKDVKLCDKIVEKATKNRCTSSFAYDTAITSGKQSDCEKIVGDDDLKNACEKNIVFTKIESQAFTGTIDICASLTGVDKDYCINRISKDADIDILQKGTTTNDIDVCGKIKDVSMKNTCKDSVYTTLALEKKDGSLCTQIFDPSRKSTCVAKFARVNDATILGQAVAANNLALCATITTDDLKSKCSDNVLLKTGVATKDTVTCAKIIDAGTKKQCTDAVNLILETINKQK